MPASRQFDKNAKGWLLSGDPAAVNTITDPTNVAPKEIAIDNAAAKFTYQLPANSIVVLRLKAK